MTTKPTGRGGPGRGQGRKAKPPAKKQGKHIKVYLTDAEIEEIKRLAESEGKSISDYTRSLWQQANVQSLIV